MESAIISRLNEEKNANWHRVGVLNCDSGTYHKYEAGTDVRFVRVRRGVVLDITPYGPNEEWGFKFEGQTLLISSVAYWKVHKKVAIDPIYEFLDEAGMVDSCMVEVKPGVFSYGNKSKQGISVILTNMGYNALM